MLSNITMSSQNSRVYVGSQSQRGRKFSWVRRLVTRRPSPPPCTSNGSTSFSVPSSPTGANTNAATVNTSIDGNAIANVLTTDSTESTAADEPRALSARDTESTHSDAHSLSSPTSEPCSNSNFTVPSISRTSVTTVVSTAAPTVNTINNHLDTASIVTLASSSKHRRRRSWDTNASIRAIAPGSRRGSIGEVRRIEDEEGDEEEGV